MGVQPHQHDIAVARKYGYHVDRGPAGQKLDESKKQYGAFTGEGRGYVVQIAPDGTVMWKVPNDSKHTERLAEGDTTGDGKPDWFPAPEWAQRSYNNPNRGAYFNTPGNENKSWEDFKVFQGLGQEAGNLGWVQGADGSWGPEGGDPVRNAEGWAVGQNGWTGGASSTPTPPVSEGGPWGDTGGSVGGTGNAFADGAMSTMGDPTKKKKTIGAAGA